MTWWQATPSPQASTGADPAAIVSANGAIPTYCACPVCWNGAGHSHDRYERGTPCYDSVADKAEQCRAHIQEDRRAAVLSAKATPAPAQLQQLLRTASTSVAKPPHGGDFDLHN